MSEEQEGTLSGLKKTLLGTLATVITAGGAWLGSTLFGGGNEEVAQAAAPAPVINITNTNSQQQSSTNNNGGVKVIERVKEVQAKEKPTEKPVKKKEGDEFTEEPPKW